MSHNNIVAQNNNGLIISLKKQGINNDFLLQVSMLLYSDG